MAITDIKGAAILEMASGSGGEPANDTTAARRSLGGRSGAWHMPHETPSDSFE
jgi:hypothetical protein